MGDDHTLETASVGSIKIKMFNGIVCTIQEVCHIKGMKKKSIVFRTNRQSWL